MNGRLLPGPDHFVVEELPAYSPVGSGEHLYVLIEKRGLNTADVARRLARICGRRAREVGYAGRKDKHAIARQWFSIHFGTEESLTRLEDDLPADAALRVLRCDRHRNKLRIGHLVGNRFDLGLADLPATFGERLARLARDGCPNRFGSQRFGLGGDNLNIARAWAQGDHRGACLLALGAAATATALPERGRGRQGARLLVWLQRHPERWGEALERVDAGYRRLIGEAAQAAVFNAVLAGRERGPGLAELRAGDIAMKGNGAAFVVAAEDLADCRQRCATGELTASAPLPGHRVLRPAPAVDAEERTWAAATGVDWAWFDRDAVFAADGDRRPVLVRFREAPRLATVEGVTRLSFALPAGAYATVVLTELGVAVPDERG